MGVKHMSQEVELEVSRRPRGLGRKTVLGLALVAAATTVATDFDQKAIAAFSADHTAEQPALRLTFGDDQDFRTALANPTMDQLSAHHLRLNVPNDANLVHLDAVTDFRIHQSNGFIAHQSVHEVVEPLPEVRKISGVTIVPGR